MCMCVYGYVSGCFWPRTKKTQRQEHTCTSTCDHVVRETTCTTVVIRDWPFDNTVAEVVHGGVVDTCRRNQRLWLPVSNQILHFLETILKKKTWTVRACREQTGRYMYFHVACCRSSQQNQYQLHGATNRVSTSSLTVFIRHTYLFSQDRPMFSGFLVAFCEY